MCNSIFNYYFFLCKWSTVRYDFFFNNKRSFNMVLLSAIFSLTDFRQALCYTVANALIYFEGLPFTLKAFPNSFTFGEANLFIQGLSLFLFSTFTRLSRVISNNVPDDDYNISTTVLQVNFEYYEILNLFKLDRRNLLQVGHMGMTILCIVPFVFHSVRNTLNMYMWIVIVIFGFITFTLKYILGNNPLLWLWSFFMKSERVSVG